MRLKDRHNVGRRIDLGGLWFCLAKARERTPNHYPCKNEPKTKTKVNRTRPHRGCILKKRKTSLFHGNKSGCTKALLAPADHCSVEFFENYLTMAGPNDTLLLVF
jgi:hypothetical protein